MHKLILFLAIAVCVTNDARTQSSPSGTWQGAIVAGGRSIGVIFQIVRIADSFKATLDIPTQGVKEMPVAARLFSDSLFLDVASVRGAARGVLSGDSLFRGAWLQNGVKLPLILRKLRAGETPPQTARPQTPKPPFPYEFTDVLFRSPDSSLIYGATLTYPHGSEKIPAVLLITGSGAQNRDEEIFRHKPFAVLADYLTRRGFLVMRVDDRGVGQTTGDRASATTLDFAADAAAAFDFLKRHPRADTSRLGLIGHSEGGMIAQILAAERSDVALVVLLAAPGVSIADLMTEQSRAVLVSSGIHPDAAASYAGLYNKLIAASNAALSDSDAKQEFSREVNEWMSKTPRPHVVATTGIHDAATQESFVSEMMKGLRSAWFRYFLQYVPEDYVRRTRAKVLAVGGDKDIQVASKQNLTALEMTLRRSGSPSFKTVELAGLNHLFQTCRKCTVAEYGELEETFSPQALEAIGNWLISQTR